MRITPGALTNKKAIMMPGKLPGEDKITVILQMDIGNTVPEVENPFCYTAK
jgi:hypothetical protein